MPILRQKDSGTGSAISWLRLHAQHVGDECLIWPFSRISSGYGDLSVHGRHVLAHRTMCEIRHGPAPEGKPLALHSCNNGTHGCVNPNHLRWGSYADNSADMISDGVSGRGRGVLTEGQVQEIREIGRAMSQYKLAARYGVSRGAVQAILSGVNWGWLK